VEEHWSIGFVAPLPPGEAVVAAPMLEDAARLLVDAAVTAAAASAAEASATRAAALASARLQGRSGRVAFTPGGGREDAVVSLWRARSGVSVPVVEWPGDGSSSRSGMPC
jgi:hypothetical protein